MSRGFTANILTILQIFKNWCFSFTSSHWKRVEVFWQLQYQSPPMDHLGWACLQFAYPQRIFRSYPIKSKSSPWSEIHHSSAYRRLFIHFRRPVSHPRMPRFRIANGRHTCALQCRRGTVRCTPANPQMLCFLPPQFGSTLTSGSSTRVVYSLMKLQLWLK